MAKLKSWESGVALVAEETLTPGHLEVGVALVAE
jgi:hypothetical protein